MVLEATVVCVDNSEWMRNGDYSPTRLEAQAEAVNLICGAKTQSNPENTVGILSMAGTGVRVLVTPCADLGKILSSMHGLDIGGEASFLTSLQVAQLALKHRQNKNQRQRIVAFIGSPLKASKEDLVRLGKKLKKSNVALDVVSFGEDEEVKAKAGGVAQTQGGEGGQGGDGGEDGMEVGDEGTGTETESEKQEKLRSLLASVNSNDNSHLLVVPSGPAMLSDVLISSPIFTGDGEGGASSAFAAAAAAGAAVMATQSNLMQQGGPGGAHGAGVGAGGGDGVMTSAGAAAAGAMLGGVGGGSVYDEFGVDPNLDPELALALRMSMEEERARQETAAKKVEEAEKKEREERERTGAGGTEQGAELQGSSGGDRTAEEEGGAERGAEEEADPVPRPLSDAGSVGAGGENPMQGDGIAGGEAGKAAASSDMVVDGDVSGGQQQEGQAAVQAPAAVGMETGKLAGGEGEGDVEAEEDEASLLQQALALSAAGTSGQSEAGGASTAGDETVDSAALLGDQQFLQSLLSTLPGVDVHDPSVQSVIRSLQKKDEQQDPSKKS